MRNRPEILARSVLLPSGYEFTFGSPNAHFPAGKAGRIIWNFEKFLVSPSDEVRRFRPTTEPDAPEVITAIESVLPRSSG